jgi:hypothetical protein
VGGPTWPPTPASGSGHPGEPGAALDGRIIAQDERDLARLGYAQQLFREMGGLSNFAISFWIISILTGAVLLFGYGLKLAGPIIHTEIRRTRARVVSAAC